MVEALCPEAGCRALYVENYETRAENDKQTGWQIHAKVKEEK